MPTAREPLNDSTFAAVLRALRAGDEHAAECMFGDLHPRLLRFLRATEPRAADDLAGEVWLAVARGLHAFEGDLAGFRAWVFVIARRRLADHRRAAGRRATDPVAQPFFDMYAGSADTEQQVLGQWSAQQAVDFIARSLPADQADVLTLRIVGDLDVAHVADVMGRSANWVRVTQHRALRRLAAVTGAAGLRIVEDHVIPAGSRTI